MKIVWATLWFLDYRIPVFLELSKIPGVELNLVYNSDVNSDQINQKVKDALGAKAFPMKGEIRLGKDSISNVANKGLRIPYQPGLVKQIMKLNPEVMISDGFFQWTYAPLFLRATKGIPHVMCYEKTNHTERNAQLVRKIYRRLVLNWIDVICCSGLLCGEYIEGLGFSKTDITYGHMVADVDNLKNLKKEREKFDSGTLRQKLGLSGIVYLYVGRMIKLKGVFELLAAWKEFISNLSEKPSLLLIGSGDQDEAIKSEILKKNLDTVKFLGRVDYKDIGYYYRIADIFILPTLEDNWSLAVSEAMASGLPVITSVYNGCWPELVQKSNGWVMDPLNKENFVNVLTESFKEKDNLEKMGQISQVIIDNHTPTVAAKSLYDSCQRAINKRRNEYHKR